LQRLLAVASSAISNLFAPFFGRGVFCLKRRDTAWEWPNDDCDGVPFAVRDVVASW
jgi:hypothetical protein